MQARTHWTFDNFFPNASRLRTLIDEHFDEAVALKKPFSDRTIWNFWFIDPMYIYLRTTPDKIFYGEEKGFIEYLTSFTSRAFGLKPITPPLLSMYVNGCGQELHNDAKNGRLAFVFSLTHWDNKRFDGGETIIHRFDEQAQLIVRTKAAAGNAFYDLIPSLFNRLLVFDDRAPHAVKRVQGTMRPQDARFVMHGHLEEPGHIAFIEGGLEKTDLQPEWLRMNEEIPPVMREHNYHGFVTVEVQVNVQGVASSIGIKHAQMLPLELNAKPLLPCLDAIMEKIADITWPEAATPSTLVFAICSNPLR